MGIGVGGMEKIGVEAIVDGLNSFLGDMKKMDKSMADLKKPASALGSVFQGLGKIISGLVSGAFRILEFALGSLLAGAIRTVVNGIKELISGIIESGNSFAKLQIRLGRLNLNTLIEGGMEYNAAVEESIRLTKEQLDWTIKLGAQTPYDSKDIANIYTLSRGYGFSADEAKGLTEAVVQFTAGMGLSNVELERVIINFGQLRQQGKLNAQDLRDLARGAFVPINKVIEITAGKLGVTVEEFNKMRQSGKLGAEAVDLFRESFEELVGTDFEGSGQALGAIFGIAVENVKGLIRDLAGLYVVAPVLLLIGGHLQDMLNALVENEGRWNSVMDSVKRIGEAILGISSDLLGLLPDADSLAEGVVASLDSIATWLEGNRGAIVDWVRNAADWVTNTLVPAFIGFVTWVRDNLIPLFLALIPLGTAIAGVFMALFSDTTGAQTFSEFIHNTLIPGIQSLTTWINTNKETIAQWIKVLAAIYIIVTVAGWVLGFIIKLVALVSAIGKIISLVGTLVSGMGPLIAIIGAVIAQLFIWKFLFTLIISNAKSFGTLIIKYFNDVKTNIINTLKAIIISAKAMDWKGIGKAIVDGIVGYVKANINLLAGIISAAIQNAINAAKATLDSGSPSKVFEDIAAGTMEGFAIGVKRNTDLAVQAMQKAVSQIAMPAFGAPALAYAGAMAPASSMNSTTNYNNTLNVHTNARSEPIISDFNMLQSLSGG